MHLLEGAASLCQKYVVSSFPTFGHRENSKYDFCLWKGEVSMCYAPDNILNPKLLTINKSEFTFLE